MSLSMEVVLEPGEEEDVVRTMSPEDREGGDSGMLLAIAVIAMIALAAAIGSSCGGGKARVLEPVPG